jgi:hypothetical protein
VEFEDLTLSGELVSSLLGADGGAAAVKGLLRLGPTVRLGDMPANFTLVGPNGELKHSGMHFEPRGLPASAQQLVIGAGAPRIAPQAEFKPRVRACIAAAETPATAARPAKTHHYAATRLLPTIALATPPSGPVEPPQPPPTAANRRQPPPTAADCRARVQELLPEQERRRRRRPRVWRHGLPLVHRQLPRVAPCRRAPRRRRPAGCGGRGAGRGRRRRAACGGRGAVRMEVRSLGRLGPGRVRARGRGRGECV